MTMGPETLAYLYLYPFPLAKTGKSTPTPPIFSSHSSAEPRNPQSEAGALPQVAVYRLALAIPDPDPTSQVR